MKKSFSFFEFFLANSTFKKIFNIDLDFKDAIIFAQLLREVENVLSQFEKLREKVLGNDKYKNDFDKFTKEERFEIDIPKNINWKLIEKYKDSLKLTAVDINNLIKFIGEISGI